METIIKYFVTNRYQRNVLNRKAFIYVAVNPCVPKGSILYSLLFKVESNDLRTGLLSNTTLFFLSVFPDWFIKNTTNTDVIIKGVGWWKEKLPLIDLFVHLFIYTLFNIDKL